MKLIRVYTKYDVIPNCIKVSYLKPMDYLDDAWHGLEILETGNVLYSAEYIEQGLEGVVFVCYKRDTCGYKL
uniref:Uncharacterized protein n=1 Tax=viral metagenome TaxID=1070528 RepID=A0A6M3L431_9ZZZZ